MEDHVSWREHMLHADRLLDDEYEDVERSTCLSSRQSYVGIM